MSEKNALHNQKKDAARTYVVTAEGLGQSIIAIFKTSKNMQLAVACELFKSRLENPEVISLIENNSL